MKKLLRLRRRRLLQMLMSLTLLLSLLIKKLKLINLSIYKTFLKLPLMLKL